MTNFSWDLRFYCSGFWLGLETDFHCAAVKGLDRAEVVYKVHRTVGLEKTQGVYLWIQKQIYQPRTQSLRSTWTVVEYRNGNCNGILKSRFSASSLRRKELQGQDFKD